MRLTSVLARSPLGRPVAAVAMGAVAVTLLVAGSGVAAKTAPMPDPIAAPAAPNIAFEQYKLANGLEVILAPDPSVPLVAFDVWYHVGSGYEVPGKSGFAHLFEHMLFQGSKNVGSDRHFDILKSAGSSEVNGTTNSDRTNYYEVLPSNQLELGLWLESDRMGHLLELVTEDSLNNQKEVVRNERRQRYDNVPYGATRFAIAHALYPDGHPYRDMTIGKHEDLANASVDDVKDFFRTWYVPSNATLALAGDFDVPTAKAAIQKWFGSFPTSTKPTVVAVPAPVQTPTRIELSDDFAKLRQVAFVWNSPAMLAPQDAELDIASDALTRPGTGRLYQALVLGKQLAQDVYSYQYGSGFSGQFQIVVTLRSGADLAEVERIVKEEVNKMRTTPITDAERARAVANIEADYVRGLESPLNRADTLQRYNHYWGDPNGIARDLARYSNATPESVRAAFVRYIDPATAIVAVTSPAAAKPVAKPDMKPMVKPDAASPAKDVK